MLCGLKAIIGSVPGLDGRGRCEANLVASNSALADYFPPNCPRCRHSCRGPIHRAGSANIAGGPLIDYLEATPNHVVPVVGELFSQMVLIIVGAPGLFVALLMWFYRTRTQKQSPE